MKKIYSKLLGLVKKTAAHQIYKEPLTPPVCFGTTVNPVNYLQDGWLQGEGHPLKNASGVQVSGWEPYFTLKMVPETAQSEPKASWSVGKQATISLPIPPCHANRCCITMRLSAFLAEENNHQQSVSVRVNGTALSTWQITSQQPFAKLVVIPSHLISSNNPLQITIETPDSIANNSQDGLPTGQALGLELYTLTAYDGLSSYLEDLQKKYDDACNYRNELIEIEGGELKDRGELVDIVNNVLTILKETEGDFSSIRNKLQNFLSCPYFQGESNDRITFDDAYFTAKQDELREGIIENEIIRWKNRLFTFKEAVLDAGNYAYRQLSTENAASYTLLDQFLQKNQYQDEKLTELKNKNEFLNNLEILLQKTEIESIPPYLEIEMTSFCNFRCVMCSRSMMKFLHTQQNDQQILQISKILPYVKYVTIAGVGEPCASRKLDILSRVLDAFKCSTIMFTNGSLLHKQLDAASRFARVNISFDGPNEEILGAQRRKSKFKTIVENIQKLKAKGTDTIIAFSVVVSRINVDEVAAIVKVAGELGVNSVSLSPVVNVPLLMLRESDRPIYEAELQEASTIAKGYGLVIHNNVHQESFPQENDTVRDKVGLIKYFGSLKVPDDASHCLDDIVKSLEQNDFSYYPDSIVFPDNKWPKAEPASHALTPSPALEPLQFEFDIDKEIQRLNSSIERLKNELASKSKDWFKLPYCLSVWKYGYVKSNGKNRLCPHRNVALGNYKENHPHDVINSLVIKKYRESMLSYESVSPMCKECFDHHRKWSLDKLKETCVEIGLEAGTLKDIS